MIEACNARIRLSNTKTLTNFDFFSHSSFEFRTFVSAIENQAHCVDEITYCIRNIF